MKNFIRTWLGIDDEMEAISKDMTMLLEKGDAQSRQIFELFHAMPFASTAIKLRAEDAAQITQPHGVQANSLPALLTGIVLNARQGNSVMEITGELDEEVRAVLTRRGFKIEDIEGTGGKLMHILWT